MIAFKLLTGIFREVVLGCLRQTSGHQKGGSWIRFSNRISWLGFWSALLILDVDFVWNQLRSWLNSLNTALDWLKEIFGGMTSHILHLWRRTYCAQWSQDKVLGDLQHIGDWSPRMKASPTMTAACICRQTCTNLQKMLPLVKRTRSLLLQALPHCPEGKVSIKRPRLSYSSSP